MGFVVELAVKVKDYLVELFTIESKNSVSIPGGGIKKPQKDKE